jgi:prepilin-type processing-associated H-X9-DG protein
MAWQRPKTLAMFPDSAERYYLMDSATEHIGWDDACWGRPEWYLPGADVNRKQKHGAMEHDAFYGRHQGRVNVGFLDGHVKSTDPSQMVRRVDLWYLTAEDVNFWCSTMKSQGCVCP